MKDFWLSCGHHLLDRDEGGGLLVTDEFLKVYLARPELAPPPEACVVERTLHATLLADPRRRSEPTRSRRSPTPMRARTGQLMIAFRDHLLRAPTLEAAYLDLVRRGLGGTPPLFLNQLVHVILRNALDGCEDAYRAARGRAVLPPAAHDAARRLADRGRRGDDRRHRRRAGLAARLDAGAAGRGRDRRHQR